MGELLRRRELILPGGGDEPTPIYTLAGPITTKNYDTGVQLFSPAISFTILCEAYYANRNWYNAMSLFGVDGTGSTFRLGYTALYKNTVEDVPSSSTTNYYTAFTMNAAGDSVTTKCTSLSARMSTSSPEVRRFAVRYDSANRLAQACSNVSLLPNKKWWHLNQNISSESSIKLLINNPTYSPQINIFRVYDQLLSDEQINSFLSGVS